MMPSFSRLLHDASPRHALPPCRFRFRYLLLPLRLYDKAAMLADDYAADYAMLIAL